MSKGKGILSQAAWFFFSYFMLDGHISQGSHDLSKWNHNEYKKHLICYSAIQSSFKLIFSVLKKIAKITTIVHPTSVYPAWLLLQGLVSLHFPLIYSSHKKIEIYPCIPIIWWNRIKNTFFWVILIELQKVHYFFEATILSSPSDIILLKSTNFSKQEFMKNIY